jgi:urease accessory protein
MSLLLSDAAHAHDVVPGLGGFAGGLLHPLFVPGHVLALIGLGLMSSQQIARVRNGIVLSFSAGLIAGFVAIVLAFAAEVDFVVLLCAVLAGLIAASAMRISLPVAAPISAAAGAALELGSVPEEISMLATAAALVATAMTATLALIAITRITMVCTREWQRIGIRIVGSWIAASAILVLALWLTR